MSDQLHKIYEFLRSAENKKYNRKVQNLDFKKWDVGCLLNNQRVLSIFWHCAKTQSNPRINSLTRFADQFRDFNSKNINIANKPFPLNVFFKEILLLNDGSELANLAKLGNGWGPKTSALLFKSLRVAARCNNEMFDKESLDLLHSDRNAMVPVDSVIKHIILNVLKFEYDGDDFSQINKILLSYKKQFDPELTLCEFVDVWDELWFWGFITQLSQNRVRVVAWNRPKLISISPVLFSNQEIGEISEKAEAFINLLNCNA